MERTPSHCSLPACLRPPRPRATELISWNILSFLRSRLTKQTRRGRHPPRSRNRSPCQPRTTCTRRSILNARGSSHKRSDRPSPIDTCRATGRCLEDWFLWQRIPCATTATPRSTRLHALESHRRVGPDLQADVIRSVGGAPHRRTPTLVTNDGPSWQISEVTGTEIMEVTGTEITKRTEITQRSRAAEDERSGECGRPHGFPLSSSLLLRVSCKCRFIRPPATEGRGRSILTNGTSTFGSDQTR